MLFHELYWRQAGTYFDAQYAQHKRIYSACHLSPTNCSEYGTVLLITFIGDWFSQLQSDAQDKQDLKSHSLYKDVEHTCSVAVAVARAVLNVRYLQVVAISDRYRFHGNVTDFNVVVAEASLNVQRRQTRQRVYNTRHIMMPLLISTDIKLRENCSPR